MLEDDGSPDTAHSLNPVPLVVTVERSVALRDGGVLADVAPTVLELLGIEQPAGDDRPLAAAAVGRPPSLSRPTRWGWESEPLPGDDGTGGRGRMAVDCPPASTAARCRRPSSPPAAASRERGL